MTVLAVFAMIAFYLFQVGVGLAGIEHLFGWGWGLAALALCFFFRFPLPMTIAAFFGARDVLGWHWVAALAFALPGVVFLIPAVMAAITSVFMSKRAS